MNLEKLAHDVAVKVIEKIAILNTPAGRSKARLAIAERVGNPENMARFSGKKTYETGSNVINKIQEQESKAGFLDSIKDLYYKNVSEPFQAGKSVMNNIHDNYANATPEVVSKANENGLELLKAGLEDSKLKKEFTFKNLSHTPLLSSIPSVSFYAGKMFSDK